MPTTHASFSSIGRTASRRSRSARALAITFLATAVVASLLLVERPKRFQAAVELAADETANDGATAAGAVDAEAILRGAREWFARHAADGAGDPFAVALSCDRLPLTGPGFRLVGSSARESDLADRLASCGRAIAASANEAALAASSERLAAARAATEAAQREARSAAEALSHELGRGAAEREEAPAPASPAVLAAAPRAAPEGLIEAKAKVARLQDALATALRHYTDAHPEVQRARLELEQAQGSLAAIESRQSESGIATTSPPVMAPTTEGRGEPAIHDRHAAASSLTERQRLADRARAADPALRRAQAAEAEARAARARLQAKPPWEVALSGEATTVFTGAASAPWGTIGLFALAASLTTAWLARGLRPVIEDAFDAEKILGVAVVGQIVAPAPRAPPPADLGIVAGRWIVRGASGALVAASVAIVAAAAVTSDSAARLSDDPASLLAMPREMIGR